MSQQEFDFIIIGTGLGATAIAHRLAETGARVVMTPGVGCARFKHLDGGVIAKASLERAFGTAEDAPIHPMGGEFTFRRDELENWAVALVQDRVTIIDGFADLRIVPHKRGGHILLEEGGDRKLVAGTVILTEGASPKIGIAARIRPDFEPEDLIHFGRAVISGVALDQAVVGDWRTSWGMPAWYSAIPHPQGAIVSASARIENIMRVGRDGREVLKDFLQTPIASEFGLPESTETVGMELVPLRRADQLGEIEFNRILITPDVNGAIDARTLDRYEQILASGISLGDAICNTWPADAEVNPAIWNVLSNHRTPYHNSRTSGFVEEGPAPATGLLRKLLKR